jgi:mannose-6-phosphate isomerase-like protein (cupin superfamily)
MRLALLLALACMACSETRAPEAPAKTEALSTLSVRILQGPTTWTPPRCTRLYVVAARGDVTVNRDVLSQGDVVVYRFPPQLTIQPRGLAVEVVKPFPCDKPEPAQRAILRADEAEDLAWAGGTMHAHLDVGTHASPDLYLGRLEGTAAVKEHDHPTSAEILVAIEASGTMTLDGTPRRVESGAIITVPKGTKHSWTPDPGSKLVAVQLYDPPGPEQRFIALAAAERDAGTR